MKRINEALLKVSLVRMDKNTSAEDAVESAANDFLNDYVLNDNLTLLIPKIINKVPVPVAAVQNKNEAILIGVKDTSPGNYLDRFMGADGYMHYADSLNIPNLTEEQVKKRIGFTIRNYSKWINNSDMTGAVLYADFGGSAGLQPIENSDGQRIEYYFTKLPNQDPTINDTISVYPVTGDELPLIPDPFPDDYMNPYDDYFKYDESLIDKTIDDGKKNSKFSLKDFSIISEVKADMVTLQDKALANPDLKKRIKKFEGVGSKGLNTPYQLEYTVDGKKIKEDFYTVGYGHKLPKDAEIREYSDEEINNFFQEDLKNCN
jgi:hypothetical protein